MSSDIKVLYINKQKNKKIARKKHVRRMYAYCIPKKNVQKLQLPEL